MINLDKEIKICNYHTHTLYCGHGKAYPIDYVREALKNDFKVLGFSEHGPLPNKYFNHTIDDFENDYFSQVTDLKHEFDNLTVYCGLEMDYFEEFNDHYKKLLNKYDYLSLSCHYLKYDIPNTSDFNAFSLDTIEKLITYKELLITGIKTKYFSFVNHPDIFINTKHYLLENLEKEIIIAAIENDIPLELNIAQMKRFSNLYQKNNVRYNFWCLVSKMKAKVIINFDAHMPSLLNKNDYLMALEFAKKLDLNLIYSLNIKDKSNESL